MTVNMWVKIDIHSNIHFLFSNPQGYPLYNTLLLVGY